MQKNKKKETPVRKVNVGTIGHVNQHRLDEVYIQSQQAMVSLVQGMIDNNNKNK